MTAREIRQITFSKQDVLCFNCGAEDQRAEYDDGTQTYFLSKKHKAEGSKPSSAKKGSSGNYRKKI